MRAASTVAALALLVTVTGCGSDREEGSAEDAFTAVEQEFERRERERRLLAAPRWEPVELARGRGDSTIEFEVSEEAIQWRLRWRCTSGELEVARGEERLGGGPCPGSGRANGIATGSVELQVSASGQWRVVIWQQVETPLREPPLPEIASGEAELVGEGDFYRIENIGRGSAALYRLPSGRLALRMERFRTAGNPGLFVWLSELSQPRTTKQAFRSPHVQIAPLKSTLGEQNYLLPPGFDPARARSVVIWCEPIRIAYAAAALTD